MSSTSTWGIPRECALPAVVAAVSAAVCFGALALAMASPWAWALYAASTLFSVLVMVVVAWLTAHWLGVGFGTVGAALLKFLAVTLAGEAAWVLAGWLPSGVDGPARLLAWTAVFVVLMQSFFELSLAETVVFVVLLLVVRFVVGFLLAVAILSRFA
ncbi:MAG: hypothetical protein ACK4PI_11735 [Tepidisphaerales bacterium]